jgi:chromosome segregation ATPase
MALTLTYDLVQTVKNTRFTYGEGQLLESVEECINDSSELYSNIHFALNDITVTMNQNNIEEKIQQLRKYETSLASLSSKMGNLKKQITGTNQKILESLDESKRKIEKYKDEKDELISQMKTLQNTISDSNQNLQQARNAYNAEKNNLEELKQKNRKCEDVQDGAAGGMLGGFTGALLGGAVTFICPPAGAAMIIGAGVAVVGSASVGLICESIKESEESLNKKRQLMNDASHRVDTKQNELNDAQYRHKNANENHEKAITKLKNEEKKPHIFHTVLEFMTKLHIETRKWESGIDEILASYSWRSNQYESIRNQNRLNITFTEMMKKIMKKIDNETLAIPTKVNLSITYGSVVSKMPADDAHTSFMSLRNFFAELGKTQ